MDITPYLGTIVTVIITVGATYVAFSSRLTRIETLMEKIEKDMSLFMNIAERVYKIEHDSKTMWLRIDELRADIKELQNRL